MNIICDLDGTIALDHGRVHYLYRDGCPKFKYAASDKYICSCKPEDRDWKSYFEACDTDEPNMGVIALLHHIKPHKINIFSGRSQTVAEKTIEWLKKYRVPYDYLQMRAPDSRVADDIMKIKWADDFGLTPANTLFILEDRTRVVEAWRAKGFRCFQVADGNF
jgi:hypothetical protein